MNFDVTQPYKNMRSSLVHFFIAILYITVTIVVRPHYITARRTCLTFWLVVRITSFSDMKAAAKQPRSREFARRSSTV